MKKSAKELAPDASFEDAAHFILRAAFRKMMDNVDGTCSGLGKEGGSPSSIEALHDMRVGSRRLRAALSLFEGAFKPKDFAVLDQEAAQITDALGAVRDLDVQLSALRTEATSLPPNEAYGLQQLIARREKERDKERRALRRSLTVLAKSDFAKQFDQILDRALPKASDAAATRKKERSHG